MGIRTYSYDPGDACPAPNFDCRRNALAVLSDVGMEVIMNAAFSFLISVGIIAFGLWITAGTIAAGSPLAWTLMGLLTALWVRSAFIKQLAMSKSRSCANRP
jgi:hypothetical protein